MPFSMTADDIEKTSWQASPKSAGSAGSAALQRISSVVPAAQATHRSHIRGHSAEILRAFCSVGLRKRFILCAPPRQRPVHREISAPAAVHLRDSQRRSTLSRAGATSEFSADRCRRSVTPGSAALQSGITAADSQPRSTGGPRNAAAERCAYGILQRSCLHAVPTHADVRTYSVASAHRSTGCSEPTAGVTARDAGRRLQ